MQFAQFYETTLTDEFGEHQLHAITIPGRYIENPALLQDVSVAMQHLGIRESKRISADHISYALIAVFKVNQTDEKLLDNVPALAIHSKTFEFAVDIAHEPLIPFESSPLSAQELVKIASSAGHGLGAALGFYVADAHPLLLLICVPAGIILCGAAKGIADALKDGLRDRILRLLKPQRNKPRQKTDESKQERNTERHQSA
jgi:hypothetical protein